MPLARIRSVVLDCPDPRALADFYLGVLGGEVDAEAEDWVVLTVDRLRLAFQQADDFTPPTWPSGERPQQFHLDLTVDDVDAVEQKVLALGASMRHSQARMRVTGSASTWIRPATPSASAGTDRETRVGSLASQSPWHIASARDERSASSRQRSSGQLTPPGLAPKGRGARGPRALIRAREAPHGARAARRSRVLPRARTDAPARCAR